MVSEPSGSAHPNELRVGAGSHRTRLVLRRDCYALLGEVPRELEAAVLRVLGAGEATVLEGRPPAGLSSEVARRIAPLYSPKDSPSYAVPTGRLFVRVADGEEIAVLRDSFDNAGFRIEEIPPYAPHSAWVVARSGDLSDALAGLRRLASVPGVEHVEPELLRAKAPR